MELGVLLAYKYPNLKAGKDYLVKDDGEGAFIAKWNAEEPQPTDEELQDAWAEYEANPPQDPLTPVEQLKKQQDLMQQAIDELIFGGAL